MPPAFATYPGTWALLPSRAPHASTSSTSLPGHHPPRVECLRPGRRHAHGRLRHRPPLAAPTHLRHLWRGPQSSLKIFDHLIRHPGRQRMALPRVFHDREALPRRRCRENGFDPHYAAGQWNIYATPAPCRSTTSRHSVPPSATMPSPSCPTTPSPAPRRALSAGGLQRQPHRAQPYGFAYAQGVHRRPAAVRWASRPHQLDTGIVHNNMCAGALTCWTDLSASAMLSPRAAWT